MAAELKPALKPCAGVVPRYSLAPSFNFSTMSRRPRGLWLDKHRNHFRMPGSHPCLYFHDRIFDVRRAKLVGEFEAKCSDHLIGRELHGE
jgi:hypothetical protein